MAKNSYLYRDYGIKEPKKVLNNIEKVVNPSNVYGDIFSKENELLIHRTTDNGKCSEVISNKITQLISTNIYNIYNINDFNTKDKFTFYAIFESGEIGTIKLTTLNVLKLITKSKLGKQFHYEHTKGKIVFKGDFSIYFFGESIVVENSIGDYKDDFENYRNTLENYLSTEVLYDIDNSYNLDDVDKLEVGKLYIKNDPVQNGYYVSKTAYMYLGKGRKKKEYVDKNSGIKSKYEDVYLFYTGNISILNESTDRVIQHFTDNFHRLIADGDLWDKFKYSSINNLVVVLTKKQVKNLYGLTTKNIKYLANVLTSNLVGDEKFLSTLTGFETTLTHLIGYKQPKVKCEKLLVNMLAYCRDVYKLMYRLLDSIQNNEKYRHEDRLGDLKDNSFILMWVNNKDFKIELLSSTSNNTLKYVYKMSSISIDGLIDELMDVKNIKHEQIIKYNYYFGYLTPSHFKKVSYYKNNTYTMMSYYTKEYGIDYTIANWRYEHMIAYKYNEEKNEELREKYSLDEYIALKRDAYSQRKTDEYYEIIKCINDGKYKVNLTIGHTAI